MAPAPAASSSAVVQELERHGSVEPLVVREPHGGHAAAPEAPHHAVRAVRGAGRGPTGRAVPVRRGRRAPRSTPREVVGRGIGVEQRAQLGGELGVLRVERAQALDARGRGELHQLVEQRGEDRVARGGHPRSMPPPCARR
jgi:hypothetical protein